MTCFQCWYFFLLYSPVYEIVSRPEYVNMRGVKRVRAYGEKYATSHSFHRLIGCKHSALDMKCSPVLPLGTALEGGEGRVGGGGGR